MHPRLTNSKTPPLLGAQNRVRWTAPVQACDRMFNNFLTVLPGGGIYNMYPPLYFIKTLMLEIIALFMHLEPLLGSKGSIV